MASNKPMVVVVACDKIGDPRDGSPGLDGRWLVRTRDEDGRTVQTVYAGGDPARAKRLARELAAAHGARLTGTDARDGSPIRF